MSFGILPPEYISGETLPMRLPSTPELFASLTSQYDSPEAALHGVGSLDQRTVDMFTNTYRKRTGDAFADPFADWGKQRDAAVMDQVLNGAGVTVGNNATGSRITSPAPVAPVAPLRRRAPNTPFQPDPTSTVPALLQRPDEDQPTEPVAPVAGPLASLLTPTIAPWAQRDAAGEQLRAAAEKQQANYRLNDATLQLRNAVNPTTGQIDNNKLRNLILQRANLLGQNAMLSRITKADPNILSHALYLSDSLFTHDAAGKVIPNENYHPLLDNPVFRQELARNPEGAAALYHAFSNRDLKTDIAAHSQAIENQQKNRQQTIEALGRSVEADPVMDEYYKTIETKDPYGSGTYQLSKVPVTPFEKSLIDSGEWQRTYGMDLPGRGGLRPIPGMNEKGLQEYRTAVQDYMGKNPKASVAQASQAVLADVAHKKMLAENPSPDTRSGPVKTADTVGQFLLHLLNRGVIGTPNSQEGLLNPLLRGANETIYGLPRIAGLNLPRSPQIPLIPVPTDQQLIESYKSNPSASDLFRQLDQWLAAKAGPYQP